MKTRLVLAVLLVGVLVRAVLACAGANGDPAPAAPEAGVAPSLEGCVDAGATE